MNKLPAFSNTPAKLILAIGLVILACEILLMALIESFHDTTLKDAVLAMMVFMFADPILLAALVAPALYFLIFKPMRAQQAEIEQQLDGLRHFQKVTAWRKLRMKELVEGNTALHHQLAAIQPDSAQP